MIRDDTIRMIAELEWLSLTRLDCTNLPHPTSYYVFTRPTYLLVLALPGVSTGPPCGSKFEA